MATDTDLDHEPAEEPLTEKGAAVDTEGAATFWSKSLVSDLRDAMLEAFKHRQKPWQQMPESEQRDVAGSLEFAAETFVRDALAQMMSVDLPSIRATLEQVTIKDGIKAVLTIPQQAEHRHALSDATGSVVMIVIGNADEFDRIHRTVKTDPDQPDMDLDEDSNETTEEQARAMGRQAALDGNPRTAPWKGRSKLGAVWREAYDETKAKLESDNEDEGSVDQHFAEGVAAFRDGKAVSDNPYEDGSDEWNRWDDGWAYAAAQSKTGDAGLADAQAAGSA